MSNTSQSSQQPRDRERMTKIKFNSLQSLETYSEPLLPGALVDCSMLNIGTMALTDWPFDARIIPYVLSPFAEAFVMHEHIYVDAVSAQSPMHKGLPSDLCEFVSQVAPPTNIRKDLLQKAAAKVELGVSNGNLQQALRRLENDLGQDITAQGLELISAYYKKERRAYDQAAAFGLLGSQPRLRTRLAKRLGVNEVWILIAMRAYFYQVVASSYRLPYVPSLERGPMVLDELSDGTVTFEDVAIRRVEEAVGEIRKEWSDIAEGFFRQHVFSPKLPLILATVLRNCDRPDQIVNEILTLRNSKEAIQFRQWCQEVSEWCKTDMELAAKAIDQFEKDLITICNDLRRAFRLEEAAPVPMNIHVVSMSDDIRSKTLLPHMVFLRNITGDVIKVPSVQTYIQRLFL